MKIYEQEIQHPSFGLMSVSRVSHGKGHYMCGTDLQPTNLIQIVIEKNCVQAMSEHSGKHVFHGSKSYAERVEVEMTYSQWANMICSMNVGEGTPCNVLFFGKDGYIEPYNDKIDTEYEYHYKKVMGELESQHEKYAEATNELKSLIDKLPKSKQDAILGIMRKLEMSITDSVPFFIKQCAETSEKIVNRAKTEISNYVESAVQQVGVKALATGNPAESKKFLDVDFTSDSDSSTVVD